MMNPLSAFLRLVDFPTFSPGGFRYFDDPTEDDPPLRWYWNGGDSVLACCRLLSPGPTVFPQFPRPRYRVKFQIVDSSGTARERMLGLTGDLARIYS